MHLKSSRRIVTILILLGICNSVYLISPSALLKRAFLRRRLLSFPPGAINGTQRLKRQLFREDIPHSRPLSGNTYYLHAGFPHPSRWHEGPQLIRPNPNPITHHHLEHHRKPGLHDDLHHNNELNSHHQQHLHHNGLQQSQDPFKVSLVHTQVPHTVSIQSDIVHGGIVDNSLIHPPPVPPHSEYFQPQTGHGHGHEYPKRPKPHSEPEPYPNDDHYGPPPSSIKFHDTGPSLTPSGPYLPIHEPVHHHPSKKPKTIIHYHPVTVGNIINFNEDPKPIKYGPPQHVPGVPLSHPDAHKDVMLAIAEPFIKTPFKNVNGPPDFLDYSKDTQYGPPHFKPGKPIGLDLAPMLPSYGPPVKEEPVPPYSVALPVLAHLHSNTAHHHHHHHHHHRPPPKRHHHRGGRHHHRGPPPKHHLHFHHIHHNEPPPPGALGSPFFDVKQSSPYIVHGHVPTKFVSFKSHSHSNHNERTYWTL